MNLLRLCKLAFKAISRNKFRTFLTMLGVIIGVAAVITMLAIGQGSKRSIQQEISKMGSNMLNVRPGADHHGPARGSAGSSQNLTVADVEAIRAHSIYLRDISPQVSGGGQIIYGSKNWNTQMNGVDIGYFAIRTLEVASGAIFTERDVATAAKVCLLGQTVVDNLFEEGEDPIGKMIRFKKVPFRVIGILASKGESTFGHDQDDLIIAPYTTIQKRILATTYFNGIYASALTEDDAENARTEIERILRESHKIREDQEDDFRVRSQQELIETFSSTSQMMTVLLASIAGISLLVGGIGIMNIMFVSVTERTREIGLRMAVGARSRDIMLQFLIEAVIISVTGGLIGMGLGIGSSFAVTGIAGWPISITSFPIILAFFVCSATGIFFGWYPAVKASRLDPIDALRYE